MVQLIAFAHARWARPIHLPAKEFTLGMLGSEASLLAEQRNGQGVGGDHHQHGNVEGHQRSEDKERAIVDDAHIRMGHYVLLIHQTCKERERRGGLCLVVWLPECIRCLPSTVIELDTSMAMAQTMAILMPARRLVER